MCFKGFQSATKTVPSSSKISCFLPGNRYRIDKIHIFWDHCCKYLKDSKLKKNRLQADVLTVDGQRQTVFCVLFILQIIINI